MFFSGMFKRETTLPEGVSASSRPWRGKFCSTSMVWKSGVRAGPRMPPLSRGRLGLLAAADARGEGAVAAAIRSLLTAVGKAGAEFRGHTGTFRDSVRGIHLYCHSFMISSTETDRGTLAIERGKPLILERSFR